MNPWYENGLEFTCTRCGNCCSGPGYVWVTDSEILGLAQFHNDSVEVITSVYTRELPSGRRILRDGPTGNCIFYDSQKGCTVYEARPIQCRTWPFWERNVATRDDWANTQKRCPGAGHGELIPVEEITIRIRQIRL